VPDDDVPDANMATSPESNAPDGMVEINGQNVPVEEINYSTIENSAMHLSLQDLESEPIEREELSDNRVAYRHVKVLQAGSWTDSGSRETIWYSPRGLENMELTEDNTVNIMHDADNEVSAVGEMENLQAEDNALYADIIINTESNAGGYADENLQKSLKTQGGAGFGGPSVEIPPEGQQITFNESKGMKELTKGKINGLGLVMNPASKPVSFARQTAQRGVAMSGSEQTTMVLKSERTLMDPEEAREILEKFGFDTGDMDDEDVVDMLMDMGEEITEYMEKGDMEGDGEGEDGEDVEAEDGEDEEMPEEEGEGMDMESKIESLEERLQNVEDMAEAMMAEEEAREELADAETVQELSEAKEELEKRLSSLEEEPEDPKSLADGSDADKSDDKSVTPVSRRDSISGSISR
jgi:hypothetical protein